MPFVIDSSCLAKLVADEPGWQTLRDWYLHQQKEDERIEAPTLALYEFGRFLEGRLQGAPPELMEEYHARTLAGIVFREPPIADAFGLASSGSTFYDASFIALAQASGATLVSADRGMLELAGRIGVRTLRF
ncbi:MAG: type II toxin-antitoxin system VapC family toxin [Candidatus Rokuibacteriota bacterium]